MNVQDSLSDWARERLNRIDTHMSAHGSEMALLRVSGVSESRVQSLYPFEISDYYTGLTWLIAEGNQTSGLLTTFGFSNVFYTISQALLPSSYALAKEVSEQKLPDHPPLANLSQRKLIFQNILQVPIVLRSLALGEGLHEAPNWSTASEIESSFDLFRNVVEEFIDYLVRKDAGGGM